MKSNEILQLISTLSANSEVWPKIAVLAVNSLKSDDWKQTHGSASDWLSDAAFRTKSTLNTFRRQIRVIEFLISKTNSDQQIQLFDRDLPFGPLEILMRINKTNPDEATKLLPSVINGDITNKNIKDIYRQVQNTPQGRSAFAFRSKQFEIWVRKFIKLNMELFNCDITKSNKITFEVKVKDLPYGRTDLWAVTDNSVDGFLIKLFGSDDNKFVIIRTLEQINFISTFYRQTWIIYPRLDYEIEIHEQFIQELIHHIEDLKLDSVGIAQIPEEGSELEARMILRPTPQLSPPNFNLIRSYFHRN